MTSEAPDWREQEDCPATSACWATCDQHFDGPYADPPPDIFAPMTRPDWAVLWLWLAGVFGLCGGALAALIAAAT